MWLVDQDAAAADGEADPAMLFELLTLLKSQARRCVVIALLSRARPDRGSRRRASRGRAAGAFTDA